MARVILASLAFAVLSNAQRYGPYVSLGPTQNEILSMETIYTPGEMQKQPNELLFLWPGISDAKVAGGDLIQTVIESHAFNDRLCKAPKGHWCIRPYVMHGRTYAESDKNVVSIAPDAEIKIVYKKTEDGSKWIQETHDMKTGKQLQSYTNGKGRMKGWGTGTESQGVNKGSAGTQYYMKTIITLAAPDMSFGKTITKTGNALYSGLSDEGEGKIWKIANITLPPTAPGT